MMSDIITARRLSITSFSQITAYREHPSAFKTEYRRPVDAANHTAIYAPVHTLTHLDFPWRGSTDLNVLANFYCQPVVARCAILDCSDKQNVLLPNLLKSRKGLFAPDSSYPLLDLERVQSGRNLWLLIRQLEITLEEIQVQLEQLGQTALKDTILLFWTSWPSLFNPHLGAFNHPSLEGVAAYLCHPYLTRPTIEWLLGQGCIGIGHDVPSFEHPLFFAKIGGVQPIVQEARDEADAELSLDRERDEGNPLEKRVFYDCFLRIGGRTGDVEPRRYYLRNLRLEAVAAKPKTLAGTITVVPIPVLRDRAGVACEVFFQGE